MDRLLREGNPPAGQLASPKPQYKKPGVDEYAPVEGQHGAPFATLKDASGNVVSPATEAKLEQVRALLSGVATENKLEQARVLLNTISTKDFATQTTLAAVLAKLGQLETEIQAVKANQLSGDQKVQLSGTMDTREVIRPRALLTKGESNVTIKTVPTGAKGFVAQLIVHGISGTWEAGGGVSFRVAHYSASRSGFHFIYDSINSSHMEDIVIKMYPGLGTAVPTGLAVKLTERWSNVNDILEERVGFRIDITGGTFSEGQGVDCELRVRWLY